MITLDLMCSDIEPEHILAIRDPLPTLVLLCLLSSASPAQSARLGRWRQALLSANLNFAVIRRTTLTEQQSAVDQALGADRAAAHPKAKARSVNSASSNWHHVCGRCGDGACERRLFQARRQAPDMSCDAPELP